MVNKKGIIKIIEASIAILIIFAAVLSFAMIRKNVSEKNLSDMTAPLLDEVAKNNALRDAILSDQPGVNESIANFLAPIIKDPNVGYAVRICEIKDICGLESYPSGISGGIYAGSRIISSSITGGNNSKKVSLFLWNRS